MKGFTIVELLLSVAIVGILAATVTGFSLFFLRSNDLELALSATSQTLRRAQTLSRAGSLDSSWGVSLQPSAITLFKGQSFALRDMALDETMELPPTIAPSGLTEVVFSKINGLPQQSGVITFTHDVIGARRLLLNDLGMVEEIGN